MWSGDKWFERKVAVVDNAARHHCEFKTTWDIKALTIPCIESTNSWFERRDRWPIQTTWKGIWMPWSAIEKRPMPRRSSRTHRRGVNPIRTYDDTRSLSFGLASVYVRHSQRGTFASLGIECFNSNGSKEVIEEYLDQTKVQVVESERLLRTILDYLRLPTLPPLQGRL
jgi:hypothetical protein